MAVIASTVLMETSGNKQGLYALFEEAKNGRSTRPEGNVLEKQEVGLKYLEEEETEKASEATNFAKKPLSLSKSKRKSNANVGSSTLENTLATTTTEARQIDMRSFVQMRSRDPNGSGILTPVSDLLASDSCHLNTLQGIESGQAENNLDPDPNYDRRKRVKTATPEFQSGRPIQDTQTLSVPDVVGYSGSVKDGLASSDEHQKPKAGDENTMQQEGSIQLLSSLDTSMATEDANSYKLIPRKEQNAKDVPIKKEQSQTCLLEDSKQGEAGPNSETPLKRVRNMLVLNSKGRFSPQKPLKRSQDDQSSEAIEDRQETKKKLMVIIRYKNYSDSPESIYNKIEAIFRSKMPSNSRRETLPLIQNSLNHHRPTHPFFISKRVDIKISEAGDSQKATGNSENVSHEIMVSEGRGKGGDLASIEEVFAPDIKNHNQAKDSVKPGSCPLFSQLPKTKSHSGYIEAPWPAKDHVHTRNLSEESLTASSKRKNIHAPAPLRFDVGRTKLKTNSILVQKSEDILYNLASHLRNVSLVYTAQRKTSTNSSSAPIEDIIRPERLIVSGPELQRRVHANLDNDYHHYTSEKSTPAKPKVNSDSGVKKSHPALERLYGESRSSLTPYDKSQSENTSWCSKYAPQNASEVLQNGREALVLRDWLKALTIDIVDKSLQNTGSSQPLRERHDGREASRLKRKKRKRAEGLDNFIVSSDEEMDQMSELSEIDEYTSPSSQGRRSMIKSSNTDGNTHSSSSGTRLASAVVLSGPNGCGKTAAVLAAAKELDFEVFEINPGMRRSGKDILERVGDMTQNHLVQSIHIEDSGTDIPPVPTEDTKKEIESGRQGTMKSFFMPHIKPKTKSKPKGNKVNKKKDTKADAKQPRQQKQSVILLEEADILFEEDKQFWITVIALITQSKRPVIVTCNDESLIPIDSFLVHAILRFSPPSRHLIVDHLLLIAANDGHLLNREAVEGLVASRKSDLRASITDLDFWCQMGVGDRKGGLEWIYQRWPPGCDLDEKGDKMRVVSKATYQFGMGWLGTAQPQQTEILMEHRDLSDAWNDWAIDVEDWHDVHGMEGLDASVWKTSSGNARLEALSAYDDILEALSAADIHPGPTFRTDKDTRLSLVEAMPSSKTTVDILQGHPQLHCESQNEYDSLSTEISIATKCVARQHLQNSIVGLSSPSKYTTRDYLLSRIGGKTKSPPQKHLIDKSILDTAFASIAAPVQSISSSQPTSQISELDRSASLIAEDIAPYIRQITTFDLSLAQQRRDLSNLLSQGGRNGKRIRTTRASRSALEGGTRASTRREKWFPGPVDNALIMRTGGVGWSDLVRDHAGNAHGGGKSGPNLRSRSSSVNTSLSSSSGESL